MRRERWAASASLARCHASAAATSTESEATGVVACAGGSSMGRRSCWEADPAGDTPTFEPPELCAPEEFCSGIASVNMKKAKRQVSASSPHLQVTDRCGLEFRPDKRLTPLYSYFIWTGTGAGRWRSDASRRRSVGRQATARQTSLLAMQRAALLVAARVRRRGGRLPRAPR